MKENSVLVLTFFPTVCVFVLEQSDNAVRGQTKGVGLVILTETQQPTPNPSSHPPLLFTPLSLSALPMVLNQQ